MKTITDVLRWYRRDEFVAAILAPSCLDERARVIEQTLIPWLGDTKLAELRPAHGDRWALDAVLRWKPGSARAYLAILSSAIRTAMHRGEIVASDLGWLPSGMGGLVGRYARNLAPEANLRMANTWSAEEVRAILDCQGPPLMKMALKILFHSGIRRGELLGLKAEDVKPTGIEIRRQYTRGRIVAPKSKRARFVELDVPIELNNRIGWIFPGEKGLPLDPRRFTTAFKRHLAAADVIDLPIHATRHTFASLALAKGVPIPWISRQLGHSNPSITLRVYAHVMEGGQWASSIRY